MDLHEALLARRTILQFVPGEVDGASLDRALDAAHHAPCHKQTWPWRFLVAGTATREALAEVAVALKNRNGDLHPAQREAIRRGALDPAGLIVVARAIDPEPVRAREDYAAVACAVQNLMLSLWADGIGTKWGTGAVTKAPATYAILGLSPDDHAIEGFVWFGRYVHVPTVHRPPVGDVVRRLP